jgi:hypothetical protein
MSGPRRFAVMTVVLAALLGFPTSAFACPSCATREGAGIGVFLMIGAMITVPYLIALVTIRVMRRLEREP